MKAEDFLIALNDADDAYVKKAGLKGGYYSVHQQSSIQNTDFQADTRNLRQETSKQRNVKRFWLAAACFALVAVSCGVWLLLKDRLGLGGPNEGASVGSSATQSMSAATEESTAPTEDSIAANEETQTTGIDTSEDIYIRICTENVLCVHKGSVRDVVQYFFVDSVLKWYLWEWDVVYEENQPYLADAASGTLKLQRGLGEELAALDAQNPENVSVILFHGIHRNENDETECAWDQYIFMIRDEDGTWIAVDATEAEPLLQDDLTEEDSLAWFREHISYETFTQGHSDMSLVSRASELLYQDPIVSNCWPTHVSVYYGEPMQDSNEPTQDSDETIQYVTVKYKVVFDKTKTSLPDVTVSQTLRLAALGNESLKLLEISEPKLTNP